jgi:membrane protein implicated in regulation of membrane protease activity
MIVDYIQAHQSSFWVALGFLLLATEVLVFGFTTIIFLFAGIGAIITGLLMMSGVLAETWISGMACFGISTGIISVLLFKPLRKMQDSPAKVQPQSSDLVGYSFVLQQDITNIQPGTHRYSGISWKVEIDVSAGVDEIKAGQRVEVVSLDAGVFRVTAV